MQPAEAKSGQSIGAIDWFDLMNKDVIAQMEMKKKSKI